MTDPQLNYDWPSWLFQGVVVRHFIDGDVECHLVSARNGPMNSVATTTSSNQTRFT